MENCLIMFQNITIAVRAKNFLERSGIHGYVQKTPRINNKSSCGYSVFVPEDTDKAVDLLKRNGFVILGRTGSRRYDIP